MSIPSIGGFRGDIESLRGRSDPEAVKAVARELEAIFAYEMIKAMRQTAEMDKDAGFGKETYMSMFEMELARLFAERGLGIKEQLLRGLSGRSGQPAGDHEAKPPKPDSPQAAENRPPQVAGENILPADGTVSSRFGMRKHPIYGDKRFHHGVDIAAPEGTEVRAVRPGRVVFSGEQHGYGNVVVIDHGSGVVTKYAHNRVNLVRDGDEVSAGDVIAKIGSTGASTGPHLHFEVKVNGKDVDPAKVAALI